MTTMTIEQRPSSPSDCEYGDKHPTLLNAHNVSTSGGIPTTNSSSVVRAVHHKIGCQRLTFSRVKQNIASYCRYSVENASQFSGFS